MFHLIVKKVSFLMRLMFGSFFLIFWRTSLLDLIIIFLISPKGIPSLESYNAHIEIVKLIQDFLMVCELGTLLLNDWLHEFYLVFGCKRILVEYNDWEDANEKDDFNQWKRTYTLLISFERPGNLILFLIEDLDHFDTKAFGLGLDWLICLIDKFFFNIVNQKHLVAHGILLGQIIHWIGVLQNIMHNVNFCIGRTIHGYKIHDLIIQVVFKLSVAYLDIRSFLLENLFYVLSHLNILLVDDSFMIGHQLVLPLRHHGFLLDHIPWHYALVLWFNCLLRTRILFQFSNLGGILIASRKIINIIRKSRVDGGGLKYLAVPNGRELPALIGLLLSEVRIRRDFAYF